MIGVLRYVVPLVVCTAIHGTRVILAALLRVRYVPGGVYDRAPRAWGRQLIAATGVPLEVAGLEALEPGVAYVYACNHTSFLDIWALLAVLPGPVRFVAKRELLRVPFFGRALRASGQIPIDRRSRRDAFAAYAEAAAAIDRGMSAIVFVEGTRSRDGSLADFKKGPFVLAIHAQAPVVPVYVADAYRALPPGAWSVRRVPVRLCIGRPQPTQGLGYSDRDAVAARAREAMLALRSGVDATGAAR